MTDPAQQVRVGRGLRRTAIIWLVAAALVGGGLWLTSVLRHRSQRRRQRRGTVGQLRTQLAQLESCLRGGGAGDFFTAMVFHAAQKASRDEECDGTALELALGRAEKQLGVAVSSDPADRAVLPFDLWEIVDTPAQLRATCTYLAQTHARLDRLARAAGAAAGPPAPDCDPDAHKVSAVALPSTVPLASDHDLRWLWVRAKAVLVVLRKRRTKDTVEMAVAHTRDGGHWQSRRLPPDLFRTDVDWIGDTLAAVTTAPSHKGFVIQVDDGGRWSSRARVATWGMHQIAAQPGGGVVLVSARDRKRGVEYDVLRSTDGGRTFSRPVTLVRADDGDRLHTSIGDDQSAVAMWASSRGPARFAGARLEPGADRAVESPPLTWNDRDLPFALPTCHSGQHYFALVGERYLVASPDGGRSWKHVVDFGSRFDRAVMACSGGRAALLTVPLGMHAGLALRVCQVSGCDRPMAVPMRSVGLWAVDLERGVELWVAPTFADIELGKGEPVAVLVYRAREGTLVPGRVLLPEPRTGNLPVLRVGGRFVHLAGGDHTSF